MDREVPTDTSPVPVLERAIAAQVRALRRATGLSVADMATKAGISKAMLSKIENAQTSCSLATLAKLAAMLDVPVTSLLRGADNGREAAYTEAGNGSVIVGRGTRVGHHYELLGALRGQHKRLEPVLVTLTTRANRFPFFQHPGTEMLYMLEGVMVYAHGGMSTRCARVTPCCSTAKACTVPTTWCGCRSDSWRSPRIPIPTTDHRYLSSLSGKPRVTSRSVRSPRWNTATLHVAGSQDTRI